MFANEPIKNLLRIANDYAAHKGFRLSSVSKYAANSGALLPGLATGERGITLRRLENVMEWFSDHWPDGLEWPADIPRPPRKEKEDAA